VDEVTFSDFASSGFVLKGLDCVLYSYVAYVASGSDGKTEIKASCNTQTNIECELVKFAL
jgi:hypothetical protein